MDCEILISEVHSRIPLWQITNPQHHNRGVLDKLWDEVAQKLNCTRKDVRMKWKYLRDQFTKELNKIPISRSGDECNSYKPSWPYFEMLLFLQDQLTAKQMSSNLCYTQSMDDQDNNETERQIMDKNVTNNDDLSNKELQESASTARENIHQTNISRKRKRPSYNTSEVNAKLLEIEEQKLKLLAKDCTNVEEKSDDYHFLISLLPLFKDFSNIQKLRVRTKFQQILMGEISQQTNLSAASSPGFGYTSNGTSSSSQYHNLTMPNTTEQYHFSISRLQQFGMIIFDFM